MTLAEPPNAPWKSTVRVPTVKSTVEAFPWGSSMFVAVLGLVNAFQVVLESTTAPLPEAEIINELIRDSADRVNSMMGEENRELKPKPNNKYLDYLDELNERNDQ